jgi:hypothetical protein
MTLIQNEMLHASTHGDVLCFGVAFSRQQVLLLLFRSCVCEPSFAIRTAFRPALILLRSKKFTCSTLFHSMRTTLPQPFHVVLALLFAVPLSKCQKPCSLQLRKPSQRVQICPSKMRKKFFKVQILHAVIRCEPASDVSHQAWNVRSGTYLTRGRK